MMKSFLAAALLLLSTSTLAEDSPHCRILKLAKLPIEFTGLQPTLQGKFNGVDLRLLMDSGANSTVLFPSAVQKANLLETPSNGVGIGVGGKVKTYVAYAKEVEIGPSHDENVRFWEDVQDKAPADGLLGADYLFRTDVELLLRDNLVTFIHADGDCGDKPLAYWDHDAFWVESRDRSRNRDLRQEIVVRINGESFIALLDSGAMHSVLDLRAAARIGLTPQSAGMEKVGEVSGIGDSTMSVWRAPIDSFEIGDEAILQTHLQIGDLEGAARASRLVRYFGVTVSSPDMVLGADFMQAHHLLFARSQHRLYFTYLGGPVFSVTPSSAELAAKSEK